jgi:2-dehydro-3-deoxyphosphogluconate aldolase/(4S)-4-hydroxy-2-oxoglutarate aldolase
MRDKLIAAKVIAIVRGDYAGVYRPMVDALLAGGVRAIEITLNSSGALEAIHMLADEYGDQALVGAGTVLETKQVAQVKEAGGTFIVCPHTDEAIIRAALDLGLEPTPGALTPSEIMAAHRAGARLIKLFPATLGGVDYLKQIRAPLNHIQFIPTGGIDASNAVDYLRAGAVAVGVGSSLVKGNFDGSAEAVRDLTQRARQLMEAVQAV